jgi:hypothetical protein
MAKLAVLLLLGLVSADQPVHCVRDSLFGEWYFHIAKETAKVDLFKTNEICTHGIPNKIQLINKDH